MKLTEEGKQWANETVRELEEFIKGKLDGFSPAEHGLSVRFTIESNIGGTDGEYCNMGVKYIIEISHDPVLFEEG